MARNRTEKATPPPEESNPKPIITAPGRRPRGETKNRGLTVSKSDLAQAAEKAGVDPGSLHKSFQESLVDHLHLHAETVRVERIRQEKLALAAEEDRLRVRREALEAEDRGPLAADNDI